MQKIGAARKSYAFGNRFSQPDQGVLGDQTRCFADLAINVSVSHQKHGLVIDQDPRAIFRVEQAELGLLFGCAQSLVDAPLGFFDPLPSAVTCDWPLQLDDEAVGDTKGYTLSCGAFGAGEPRTHRK